MYHTQIQSQASTWNQLNLSSRPFKNNTASKLQFVFWFWCAKLSSKINKKTNSLSVYSFKFRFEKTLHVSLKKAYGCVCHVHHMYVCMYICVLNIVCMCMYVLVSIWQSFQTFFLIKTHKEFVICYVMKCGPGEWVTTPMCPKDLDQDQSAWSQCKSCSLQNLWVFSSSSLLHSPFYLKVNSSSTNLESNIGTNMNNTRKNVHHQEHNTSKNHASSASWNPSYRAPPPAATRRPSLALPGRVLTALTNDVPRDSRSNAMFSYHGDIEAWRIVVMLMIKKNVLD